MSSMYIIVYANYKSNDNVNTYDDRHDRELVEFTKFINFEGVEDVLLYCYAQCLRTVEYVFKLYSI